MPRPHESDLRWFLDGSRDAALGMKSNHASFVARMEGSTGGTPTEDTDIQDRLVEAAARDRRIRELFERCSHDSQRVLAAYYRQDKLVRYWREITHVLPFVKAFVPAKHGPPDGGLAMKMTSASTTADQRIAALAIRQEADALVDAAHLDYLRQARRAGTTETRSSL